MSRVRWAAALTAAFGVGAGLLPADARACSVCLAGDPSFSSHGTSGLEVGDFAAYLELRGWRKRSGLLPGEEGHGGEEGEGEAEAEGFEWNRSQRLDLYLSWSPLDRTSFTLDVPYAFNQITEVEGDSRETSSLDGFGDLSLTAGFVVWRNRPILPSTWVELRAFLKAPTGSSSRRVDGREDPHLQPGTGSWDYGAGLAATRRLDFGAVYGSLFYRENREGSLDYEYGDVLLANAALEVPLGHALGQPELDLLTPGLELNFRYAGYDEFEGQRYRDSGGAILFVTPSLRVKLPFLCRERPPSLRLAVQLPLSQTWLHNSQREREVWSAGLLVPF